jgi:hypothetical protein
MLRDRLVDPGTTISPVDESAGSHKQSITVSASTLLIFDWTERVPVQRSVLLFVSVYSFASAFDDTPLMPVCQGLFEESDDLSPGIQLVHVMA